MIDTKKIRSNFPALSLSQGRKIIYFDNACSVLKPKKVIEAVNDWLSSNGSCAGGRSGHMLSASTEAMCEQAREKVAHFCGFSSKEIIFTGNTTAAINLAVNSYPFSSSRNEVVLFAGAHHSLLLPLAEQEKKGRIHIHLCGVNSPMHPDEKEILNAINERTAMVAMPLASNITGEVFNTEEIIKKAHSCGAVFLADAAAFIPYHKPNFAEQPDFMAFSAHKFGAMPIGVLACREEIIQRLNNAYVGGGTVTNVEIDKGKILPHYIHGYKHFEAGIQNYPAIISAGAAIDFIESIGRENIFSHSAELSSFLINELKKISDICILEKSPKAKSATVSFYFKNKNICLQDFNIFLNSEIEYSICTRIGRHCAMPAHMLAGIDGTVRLSFFAYNTPEEIKIFVDLLHKFLD